MGLPNNSVLVTPGAGETIATHAIGGKEYQVVILAGPAGHLLGTRESYNIIVPPVSVVGASKVHFDLFHAAATGKTIEVHGLWMGSDLDVAVTGTLATRVDLFRTSTVGTGGTAITFEPTTAVRGISRINPADTDPIAGGILTAREAPAGGATTSAFIGQAYFMPEEAATSFGYYTWFQNLIRYAGSEDMKDLVIPSGQGLKIVQGPVASVGKVGLRMAITIY